MSGLLISYVKSSSLFSDTDSVGLCKPDIGGGGGDPLSFATEIIIEIKQFWSNGITSLYRKYMVYPLKGSFTIGNGPLD